MVVGRGEGGAAVTCLNQLYSQAMAVAPRLLGLSAEWAAAVGGAAAAAAAPPALSPGAGLEAWVERGLVKAPRRAAEKARACYAGDVSQVLDVSRAQLWFDTAAGVAAGLAALAADPRVEVVLVKNTMLPATRPARTAGFRVRSSLPGRVSVCLPAAAGADVKTTLF